MVGVMAVGIGLRTGSRTHRPFLKVWIVSREVGITLTLNVRNRAIWLQGAVRGGRDDVSRSIYSCEFAEFVLSGKAQIPVAVENAVLSAAAKFERMTSDGPRQVVLKLPAILGKADDLTTLGVASQLKRQASTILVIDQNIGKRIRYAVAFLRHVKVAIMCDRELV